MSDTFAVGIHRTDRELRLVVSVPPEIDSEWRDPDAFQRLVESTVWEVLDREMTLASIVESTDPGETVSLGTVTLSPGGELIDHDLSVPDRSDPE